MLAKKTYDKRGNSQYIEAVKGTHAVLFQKHQIKKIQYLDANTKDNRHPYEIIIFIVEITASDN